MRRSASALGVVLLAAIVVLAPAAEANHTSQRDPNDTRGLLDVRALRFDHHPGARWTFTMFERWTVNEIWDAGYLIVRLDMKGGEAIDYLAIVRSDGRALVATLYRVRSSGREVEIGALETGKGGSRGAWVSVALHKLAIGGARSSYFWSAVTTFTGRACPRTCLDRVPDEGRIEQLLPGVSPSPSPSPSPSSTPSPSPSPS